MRKVRISRVVMLSILVPLATSCASARGSSVNRPFPTVMEVAATPEERPSLSERRRRQFDERRASGRGVFLTEEEIRNAKASTLLTLFRHVPGVRLSRGAVECQPAVIVDGVPANNSTDLDMSTMGITGIEIYRTSSETPLEFLGVGNACGTIVIWTRSGL
jgi:hypothetical protein